MGLLASIDIQFAHELSPKEVAISLINNGWMIDFEESVTFLMPTDIDNYDWQMKKRHDFSLENFLNLHTDNDRIGIVLVSHDNVGGEFLIYSNWLSFSLSINRAYISSERKIVDFSMYLEKLRFFIETIDISSIQCELVY
ncbi:hypothetical protein I2492_14170 [Budviciaceae bacterium CWB-B4]|uniref:Uncharacterized protein n=1 Tax=Limnobaculum xujianqingii TaxID=2738837 RepID=A0A9D7AJR9_9GAMM|nr:hypothetical protein [Limnobaculum xujianqingii]MBK5074155.1 hypothetical protein [Limnobaculum xujianqingii]MBK5177464.1 hypothetical protein [Limnobaculum xujianqingii]